MKKLLDKIKERMKNSKKMVVFFIVLLFIGIIAGTFFSLVINKNDKILVNETVQSFFSNNSK